MKDKKKEINQILNETEEVNNNGKKGRKIGVKLFVLLIILVLIGGSVFAIVKITSEQEDEQGSKKEKNEVGRTKTVMIYMCGSDLESGSGVATVNLEQLMDSKVDYKNINVLLCAGGAKKWFNSDISYTETSIYEINDKGISKIKKQNRQDMGNTSTVKSFLDYVYENYETDEYYLMFWNHGMGLNGLEYDELSRKYLSLADVDKSLKESLFNKNDKKFNMVILNNCLMGSIETASIMSKYADYLVASEDIMYGSSNIKTFEFLDGIKEKSSALDIGKSYINCYSNSAYKVSKDAYTTISLIDLSKVDDVISNLGDYISKINLNDSTFRQIARIRSNMYEYQKNDDYYDLVDMHLLVSSLGKVNGDNKKLLSSIDDMVVYNKSTDPYSKGISIYFPETYDWTYVYNQIDFSNSYKAFTKKYVSMVKNKPTVSFSFNSKDLDKKESSVSVELAKEECDIYKNSVFRIYQVNDDGTYTRFSTTSNTNLSEDGQLTADVNTKAIKVICNSDNSELLFGGINELDRTNEYTMISASTPLMKSEITVENANDFIVSAISTIKVMNNGDANLVNVLQANLNDKGTLTTNGAVYDIGSDEFETIHFLNHKYKFEFDENGNLVSEGTPIEAAGLDIKIKDGFSFKKCELDPNKKYVGVFCIEDIYGNTHYSKFIDIKD